MVQLPAGWQRLWTTVGILIVLSAFGTEANRSLLSDPGITLATIESADGYLPAVKPVGFFYEPVLPEFYKLINNITYFEFNGTYYEDLYGNGTFVEAIASTINGTFTLTPITSIESAGSDGYDYGQVLGLSLLFYEAQRSGTLESNNRIAWRGNSGTQDTSPGGTNVQGGWYDAGDNLKLNFPAAFTASNLAWAFLEFQQGFVNSGNQAYMLDTLRWISDYFVLCNYGPSVFTAQVGDVNIDHSLWGRPEDITPATESRPSYDVTPTAPDRKADHQECHIFSTPTTDLQSCCITGSDLVGEAAATLAACSIVFQQTDPTYSATLLMHAEQLWKLGTTYEGKYSDSISAAFPYPSTSYFDDLAWASVWLYKATNQQSYLDAAHMYAEMNTNQEGGGGYQAYNWDGVSWGVYVLLAQIDGPDSEYISKLQGFMEAWIQGSSSVSYTPSGLAYLSPWGSLRHTSGAALIAVQFANSIESNGPDPTGMADRYSCWARGQIRYMLGDSGRSYVVGFGKNPPTHCHHRGASCMSEAPSFGSDSPSCSYTDYALSSANPNIIYGALVGGPGPDDSYADSRSDYQKNEVAVDYNAAFTGVLAYLAQSTDTMAACISRGDVKAIIPATNNS